MQLPNSFGCRSTDGFDPDSCTDVRLHDSIIDTGDDGISIKSGNVSAEEMAARAGRSIRGTKQTVQRPAKDIHIYRTKVLSRNFCLGSATYGGIFNLLVEDCEIGDDEGSASWGIKYKSTCTHFVFVSASCSEAAVQATRVTPARSSTTRTAESRSGRSERGRIPHRTG